jgi:NAD(P)-dependent dehydrogenase (short-subunit alcohol dehydrogenase family)
MSLADKRIVIIGGSSGMGLATAKAAAAQGARVVIAGRSREKLEKAQGEISGPVEAMALDISNEPGVKAFFAGVGEFDHLTTPGSTIRGGPFLTLDTAQARGDFDSKFWGQYLAAKYGAPFIRPGGSIVFFSGIYAARPQAGVSSIAAINSGIEGLARALAVELAPIRVNVVSPGVVDTPRYAAVAAEPREAMFKAYAAAVPVKRVGRPDDVAQTVLYLMTNEFTTGSTIFVDGGFTLR